MIRLGVSLPWDYLSGSIVTKEAEVLKMVFSRSRSLLKILANEGVSSIEFRHRHRDLSSTELYRAIETVVSNDMSITIHGDSLPVPESFDFNRLFPWSGIVNELYRDFDSSVTVTFHPIIVRNNGKLSAKLTAETLGILANHSSSSSYIYVLENQRSRGYMNPGITFAGIVDMVKQVPDNMTGICWDMGHSYSNVINYNHPLFPPKEFLERVQHTHIHDLGPTGRTHWPFKENNVPLEENVKLLKSYNYKGTYNLELSFDRFAEEQNIMKLVTGSIKILRDLV